MEELINKYTKEFREWQRQWNLYDVKEISTMPDDLSDFIKKFLEANKTEPEEASAVKSETKALEIVCIILNNINASTEHQEFERSLNQVEQLLRIYHALQKINY